MVLIYFSSLPAGSSQWVLHHTRGSPDHRSPSAASAAVSPVMNLTPCDDDGYHCAKVTAIMERWQRSRQPRMLFILSPWCEVLVWTQGSLGRRKVRGVKLMYINLMKTDSHWKEVTLTLETGSQQRSFASILMVNPESDVGKKETRMIMTIRRKHSLNMRRRRPQQDDNSSSGFNMKVTHFGLWSFAMIAIFYGYFKTFTKNGDF